jgi:hypothetical protein
MARPRISSLPSAPREMTARSNTSKPSGKSLYVVRANTCLEPHATAMLNEVNAALLRNTHRNNDASEQLRNLRESRTTGHNRQEPILVDSDIDESDVAMSDVVVPESAGFDALRDRQSTHARLQGTCSAASISICLCAHVTNQFADGLRITDVHVRDHATRPEEQKMVNESRTMYFPDPESRNIENSSDERKFAKPSSPTHSHARSASRSMVVSHKQEMQTTHQIGNPAKTKKPSLKWFFDAHLMTSPQPVSDQVEGVIQNVQKRPRGRPPGSTKRPLSTYPQDQEPVQKKRRGRPRRKTAADVTDVAHEPNSASRPVTNVGQTKQLQPNIHQAPTPPTNTTPRVNTTNLASHRLHTVRESTPFTDRILHQQGLIGDAHIPSSPPISPFARGGVTKGIFIKLPIDAQQLDRAVMFGKASPAQSVLFTNGLRLFSVAPVVTDITDQVDGWQALSDLPVFEPLVGMPVGRVGDDDAVDVEELMGELVEGE